MPFPRRYERLVALDDSQLDVTLQSLSISRNELSLPPRKRNIVKSAVFPPLQSPRTAAPPPEPVLSDRMVQSIVAAAAREKRRGMQIGKAAANGNTNGNANARANRSVRNMPCPPRKMHSLAQQPEAGAETDAEMRRRRMQTGGVIANGNADHNANGSARNVPRPPRKMHSVAQQPETDAELSAETKNEFRTARSRLPIKRRAGMQSTRHRPQQRGLNPLHKRVCVAKPAGAANVAPPAAEKEVPEIPNVEPRLVEAVMSEMLENSSNVDWDDIAGLQFAKNCVMEAVVWPMLRPDIFTGLRGPPKGLLLFGPPGTGKTMIGRAIASKSGAKFFNISASSLVSKWAGEGEKTVRALFAVARLFQPAVVFIDEIDSLLTSRSEGEQEFSRRIKTEFLVQMDGAGTSREDRVLVVGATNRPQELDEAARRRLVKRLYIPLPEFDARVSLMKRLLEKQVNDISGEDAAEIARATKGYSGSDMYALCAEAALAPVRELGSTIKDADVSSVRPVAKADFLKAARMVRASVGEKDLAGYQEWNERFGSFPYGEDGDGVGGN